MRRPPCHTPNRYGRQLRRSDLFEPLSQPGPQPMPTHRERRRQPAAELAAPPRRGAPSRSHHPHSRAADTEPPDGTAGIVRVLTSAAARPRRFARDERRARSARPWRSGSSMTRPASRAGRRPRAADAGGRAQRVLLFLNPQVGHSVQRVTELAALYDEISEPAAHHLLWMAGGQPPYCNRACTTPCCGTNRRTRGKPLLCSRIGPRDGRDRRTQPADFPPLFRIGAG